MRVTQENLLRQDSCQLLRYLDKAREAGDEQEEGEFGLSAEAALRKLGQFRLPRVESWVLKLVQCANSLQCEALYFRLSRQKIEICFTTSELPKLVQLQEGLESFQPCALAERHLRAAILALREKSGTLLIEYQGESWNGRDEVSELDGVASSEFRCEFEQFSLSSFWQFLRGRLRATCDIHQELLEYAYLSKTQVLLDSRRVTRVPAPFILMNGLLNDNSEATLDIEGDILQGKNWEREVFSRWARNSSPLFGYVVRVDCLPSARRTDVSLQWIDSGVVVEKEDHDMNSTGRLLVRVLISASGLRTDLSGLKLLNDDEKRWRRRRAAFYAWHALDTLSGQFQKDWLWEQYAENTGAVFTPDERDKIRAEVYELLRLFSTSETA